MQLRFRFLADNLYDDVDSDLVCFIFYGVYMLVCEREGSVAIFISSLILGVLLAQAVSLNIITYGFYVYQPMEVLTWIAGVLLLRRKPKEYAVEIGLSIVIAFVYQLVIPYWG